MSVFQRLRSALRLDVDRVVTADVKPLMDFSTIDLEKIRAALSIEKRGQERGARNEPPTESAGLDEVELEIVGAMAALRNESYENYSKQMSAYDGRLARLDLRTIVPEVKTMLSDAEADFSAEAQKDTNHVFAYKEQLIAAQDAYVKFRSRFKLERLAATERNPVFSFAIIALIFFLETVANAGFFSATHPGGLFGAIFEAAGISFINLAVGFVLGVGILRYLQLPSFFWRVSMFTAGAAFVALALVFNLFAAHYRDAFSLIPADADDFMLKASRTAMQNLLTEHFTLVGFQSYMMVLVGLLVVAYATFKGFTWLDPFPGYGAAHKRYMARLAEYLELIDDLVRNLQERKDQAIAELRESITDIRRRDEEYGVVVAERQRLTQRYNGYVESLQRSGQSLLSSYRAANRAARSTPQPDSFGIIWQPGWNAETSPDDHTRLERRQAVEELLQAIAVSQTRLLEVFKSGLTEYDKLRDFDPQASARAPVKTP